MLPWLPEGRLIVVEDRGGELFYRHHRHPDPAAPTVLLLHGWTASADLQFFTAYPALAEHCSFVALDHRGHGRGLRPAVPFELEDAADDAAALLDSLGITSVITVGYSMGGPISMLLARRRPDLVRGIVVQATGLDWSDSLLERIRWKTVRVIGPVLRSWAYPRWVRFGIRKLLGSNALVGPHAGWLAGEVHRNDAFAMVQAGQALSRYDARPWAAQLARVPCGSLITTADRLVRPRKQRALAAALGAHVVEVRADHLCTLTSPDEYAAATVELLADVVRRSGAAPVGA